MVNRKDLMYLVYINTNTTMKQEDFQFKVGLGVKL